MHVEINCYSQGIQSSNIEAQIPGYMHDNVIMYLVGSSTYYGRPTGWNDTHCRFEMSRYFNTFNYGRITVLCNDLETKNTIREPIKIVKKTWNGEGGFWEYKDMAEGKTRAVKEYYSCYIPASKSYTYTTATNYSVHNSNVYKLQVTGDPRGLYCAG